MPPPYGKGCLGPATDRNPICVFHESSDRGGIFSGHDAVPVGLFRRKFEYGGMTRQIYVRIAHASQFFDERRAGK